MTDYEKEIFDLLRECYLNTDIERQCWECPYHEYNPDQDDPELEHGCALDRAAFLIQNLRDELDFIHTCVDPESENIMNIKFLEGAYYPIRAHETDAGLDLRSCERKLIPARGSATFDTRTCIQLPHGYYGKIESKSGLNVKHGIVSCGGVIDEPYTGSIVVKLYNLSDNNYLVEQGDKIAQLVIMPYSTPSLNVVCELDETDRGDSGFGSTGR